MAVPRAVKGAIHLGGSQTEGVPTVDRSKVDFGFAQTVPSKSGSGDRGIEIPQNVARGGPPPLPEVLEVPPAPHVIGDPTGPSSNEALRDTVRPEGASNFSPAHQRPSHLRHLTS